MKGNRQIFGGGHEKPWAVGNDVHNFRSEIGLPSASTAYRVHPVSTIFPTSFPVPSIEFKFKLSTLKSQQEHTLLSPASDPS